MAKKTETEIRVFSANRFRADKTSHDNEPMHIDALHGAHIKFNIGAHESFISKPRMWVARKWTVSLEDWEKGVR